MKPKITKAMVDAVESVLDQAVPLGYEDMSEADKREARRAALRSALAAAIRQRAEEEGS